LDQCKNSAEALVKELEKFKSSSALNQAAAHSLDNASIALARLHKEIVPFTDVQFRFFQKVIIAWSALNTCILITVIVVMLVKK